MAMEPEDDTIPALSLMRLNEQFSGLLPGMNDPTAALRLLARLKVRDGLEIWVTLQLAHPEIAGLRNRLLAYWESLCALLGIEFVLSNTCFWPRFESVLEEMHRIASVLKRTGSPPDQCANFDPSQLRVMLCAIQPLCGLLRDAIDETQEKLAIFTKATTDLSKLSSALDMIEEGLAAHCSLHTKVNVASPVAPSSSTSSVKNGQDLGQKLLQPQVGINKADSFSTSTEFTSGFFGRKRDRSGAHHEALPRYHANNLGRQQQKHKTTQDTWARRAANTISTHWRRLRSKRTADILGHEGTVWTLVIALALAGIVSTAIAVWKAGPQAQVPEIDSNFYSTISQNSFGAGGLYCIVIPVLRGIDINTTKVGLFRFWLLLSGIGALCSSVVYPVQVRTSIVLACLSSLAQLFATLQIIEDAGKQVTTLVVEGDGLRSDIDGLEVEGDYLRSEVSYLQQEIAALRPER